MFRDRKRYSKPIRCRGKALTDGQIKGIRDLIRSLRGETRRRINIELCRKWNWRRSNGALSLEACGSLLRRLDGRGLIKLPEPRNRPGPRRKIGQEIANSGVFERPADIDGDDLDLSRVNVRPVLRAEIPRWRELMARFHYLGDGELVGESLRYVAESESGWLALQLTFRGSAKHFL
jgi:ribosomal protein L28